jgi:ABC-type transporter MlaC component
MQVSANGEKIDFLYFLVKVNDGYKLVDYEVSGALLSRNYRGQFNYMMRKYGFNGMLEKMRKKTQMFASRATTRVD